MRLPYIVVHQQRGMLKIFCEQPSFHIEMESLPLTRQFHAEHNDTHCSLPSTFLLDEFAL